ncbi:MAG: c-type cytochrome [Alsobacter sp.]|jgi:cytochrome c553|nr:c-type cytochrome [Burkholderiales bacterium]
MARRSAVRVASVLAAMLAVVASADAQQRPRPPVTVEACAPCHGVDGIAKDVEVPHLAGQNVVYLYNQLKAFKSGKRPHKEMRYMSRHVSEAEMEALADYYASLPRE